MVYDPNGQPREVSLGCHGTADARARYAKLCADLQPGNVYLGDPEATTVADLILGYWRYASGYYGGGEVRGIRGALRALREIHGDTPAAEFGPLSLKAVRAGMVAKGWSRSHCNAQVRRIVRLFRWAAGEEMVPVAAHTALKTLAPLRAGKTEARETEARKPAHPADVVAALPHLPPHARALVEVLRITGMRPGEVCRMRLADVDRTAPVWVYTVGAHKTAHRGCRRAVHLGAAAQAVIVAHLGRGELRPDEPLFSPRRQREQLHASMRATRQSKVQPSQLSRKKAEGKRLPGEAYTAESVCRAVRKACRAAGVPAWTPYQLRHLVAAELRLRFSLEHVRAALGHSHASMTAHYASGADAKLAGEVAGVVG